MSKYKATSDSFTQDSKTLTQKYFISNDIYSEELEKIFFNSWLCIGRSEQLSSPGKYIKVDIGNESAIALLDNNNKYQAFYNVCRHRGTRLCNQEEGELSNSIQCEYHAWTYDLEGNLIGAPHMDKVENFEMKNYGLKSIEIVEWEGFLFIHLGKPAQSFHEFFEPIIDKFSKWEMGKLTSIKKISYEVNANWKIIAQNYSECYHCALVHPELNQQSSYLSGMNDLTEGPFLGGYMDLEKTSLSISGEAVAKPFDKLNSLDLKRVYYYSIFPHMLLSPHPDYVMVHTLWPQSVTKTKVTCEWLFSGVKNKNPEFNPLDAINFWDMINLQDWKICQNTQLGIQSKSFTPGPYSSQESLLAAMDNEYLRVMRRKNI